MGEIIINDFRGKNKPPREEQPKVIEIQPEGDKSAWLDVGYYVIQAQTNVGMLMLGRATGKRSDCRPFAADYLLPPVWAEDFKWQPEAKKRLDTYLNCDCGATPCAIHRHYHEQWHKADQERLQAIITAPLPESVELVIKAETMAKQSQIVVPGRG